MALDSAWNMYIFRDGKNVLRGADLVRDLSHGLAALPDSQDPNRRRTCLTDLVLRAGELECALADAASYNAGAIATVTDALADSLVANIPFQAPELAERVQLVPPPEQVKVAPPEGFAYYSLHPLDFVEVVCRMQRHSRFAAVIGIRSIGTTLSAVVQAALRRERVHAQRITVRPSGHPYDRRTTFTSEQSQWIASMQAHSADFIIVDEGPGMSGSSFLSVGEALLGSGVPRSAITFLGTREPDHASLTAPEAASRWPQFSAYFTRPTAFLPRRADRYIAGGIWRADVFASEQDWPASWLQMERLKFSSKENDVFYAFEGFGRFGEEVRARAVCVANAGFGPMPLEREEGFGVYPVIHGRHLSAADATPEVLTRLAEYCAFRAQAISSPVRHNEELETMLRFNAREEFGLEPSGHHSSLPIIRPAIADGRMLPHKWIESARGLLKVDSATHGDNHFFPGPTDIAWDLAGTVVEWNLDPLAAQLFINAYARLSQDDPGDRLPAYTLAYAIFRMAYSKMAAAAMRGAPEEGRLIKDYLRYRRRAERLLSVRPPATIPQAVGYNRDEMRIA
jgi:hypothetical protein